MSPTYSVQMTCAHHHEFEGRFVSEAMYREQMDKGLLVCPVCGSADLLADLPEEEAAAEEAAAEEVAAEEAAAEVAQAESFVSLPDNIDESVLDRLRSFFDTVASVVSNHLGLKLDNEVSSSVESSPALPVLSDTDSDQGGSSDHTRPTALAMLSSKEVLGESKVGGGRFSKSHDERFVFLDTNGQTTVVSFQSKRHMH